MIDDIRFMRIIEYASELGLIILTHAGIDIGLPQPVHCPPDKMRKVLDTVKPQKMVLAHYGGWKQWEEVYYYLAGENVYLDTAFLFGVQKNTGKEQMNQEEEGDKLGIHQNEGGNFVSYIESESFMKILSKHGSDKILFATDSPWSDAKAGIEYIRNMSITEKAKEQILGGNAVRLLGGVL